jgi:branched-chain amino acid transport system permease protein
LGTPFFFNVLIGIVVSALISLLVSIPSLRLHDDYFVIATFGFQIIIFSVLNNWVHVTRGPMGISGIPQPRFFGWTVNSQIEFVFLSTLLASLAYSIVFRLSTSPFGRVLRAVREDEIFAQSVGKNILWFKVLAFAISAGLASIAGSLYAHYITYIDPTSFTIMESILVISMVIIGGADSRWGPFIGAVVLVTLPEALRFLGLPTSVAGNVRQMIYGMLLIIMMMFRPRGLVGKYNFGH